MFQSKEDWDIYEPAWCDVEEAQEEPQLQIFLDCNEIAGIRETLKSEEMV